MDFPKDAGLTCVRYFLEPFNPELEQFASDQLRTQGRLVGSLLCQCGSRTPLWGVDIHQNKESALLTCHCNGSQLPVYMGPPPVDPELLYSALWSSSPTLGGFSQRTTCPNEHTKGNPVAIAIGYPGEVPAPGSLDVERAQELVIAARCVECAAFFVAFERRLLAPVAILGDELWLLKIPGIRAKSSPLIQEYVRDPNRSWRELKEFIGRFPFEVLSNPVLALLALEDPAAWQQLISSMNPLSLMERLQEELGLLDKARQQSFALDCIERLLPVYEEKNPGDARPRRALEAARLYLQEKASRAELLSACQEVQKIDEAMGKAIIYAAHPDLLDAHLALTHSIDPSVRSMSTYQEMAWQAAHLASIKAK